MVSEPDGTFTWVEGLDRLPSVAPPTWLPGWRQLRLPGGPGLPAGFGLPVSPLQGAALGCTVACSGVTLRERPAAQRLHVQLHLAAEGLREEPNGVVLHHAEHQRVHLRRTHHHLHISIETHLGQEGAEVQLRVLQSSDQLGADLEGPVVPEHPEVGVVVLRDVDRLHLPAGPLVADDDAVRVVGVVAAKRVVVLPHVRREAGGGRVPVSVQVSNHKVHQLQRQRCSAAAAAAELTAILSHLLPTLLGFAQRGKKLLHVSEHVEAEVALLWLNVGLQLCEEAQRRLLLAGSEAAHKKNHPGASTRYSYVTQEYSVSL